MPERPRLTGLPFRPPVAVTAVGLVVVGFLIAAIAIWGAENHPDLAPPVGREAEQHLTDVFGLPIDGDEILLGDLLIERFYVLDEAGKRFVADLCKGRIKDIFATTRRDGEGLYSLVLDRDGLAPERDRISAFVASVAAPQLEEGTVYLGVYVQDGLIESFAVNYNGTVPPELSPFELKSFPDAFAFLAKQPFSDVTGRLIDIRGTNYLLSSTDLFPYFRDVFKTQRAIFVSQLIFVDRTSPEQAELYKAIAERVPARTPGR